MNGAWQQQQGLEAAAGSVVLQETLCQLLHYLAKLFVHDTTRQQQQQPAHSTRGHNTTSTSTSGSGGASSREEAEEEAEECFCVVLRCLRITCDVIDAITARTRATAPAEQQQQLSVVASRSRLCLALVSCLSHLVLVDERAWAPLFSEALLEACLLGLWKACRTLGSDTSHTTTTTTSTDKTTTGAAAPPATGGPPPPVLSSSASTSSNVSVKARPTTSTSTTAGAGGGGGAGGEGVVEDELLDLQVSRESRTATAAAAAMMSPSGRPAPSLTHPLAAADGRHVCVWCCRRRWLRTRCCWCWATPP